MHHKEIIQSVQRVLLKNSYCENIVGSIGKCPNWQESFGKLMKRHGKVLVMGKYLKFVVKNI